MDISINVPKTSEINISGNTKEIRVPDKSVTYAKLADDVTLILSEKADKASTDSALEQKADKDSVDAEISGVNVALERIKYYGSADVVPSDESWFTVNSTGETITGLTDTGKTQTELVIPYEINGVIITRIENYAFYNCGSITSITIPNSIYSFGGSSVFKECESLKTINIPNRISDIGESAFQGCTSLTSINLTNNIKSIYNDVFSGCTSLVSMKIPDSVTSISFNAFSNCTSLTEIEIPNSVTSIAPEAFEGCTNLKIYCEQGSYAETYAKDNNIPVVYTDVKDITAETELERFKYYGDKDIIPSDSSYFTVNETGETITGLTDEGKTQTELVIPYEINGVEITTLFGSTNSISGLPQSILDGSSVTKVVIPKSVTILGEIAFYECSSLNSINIPNSITSIGPCAFSYCSSLTSINISNNVTSIGYEAFSGCTNLTIYCEQGSTADDYARNNNIPVVYTDITDEPTFRSMTVNGDINFINSNRVGMNGVYMVDYEVTAVDTSIPKEHHLTHKADTAEVLTKTNTTAFAPTADYQPATKKYVDDAISAAISAYDTEAMALLGGDAE